uniref:DUF1985 domain-containing protein n=1 Tax=Cucumis melo TaxID=3656 RepID=A0A9I9EE41_CUCME
MEDEQKKNLRITVYYSLETLNQIKSKIDKRILSQVLTNSPFGQFLNIKMTKIPTKFLNFLLRKQYHTKKKTNVLAFNFNEHIAEFALKGFCFVTGLKGHKFPELNLGERKQNGLKNALFRHDDFITRRDIERTFKALYNEEDSLKEKLVNLYILEAFLIPKQQHNHINLLHLDILDNEEIFKGYPWGMLSYILTYQFLKSIL